MIDEDALVEAMARAMCLDGDPDTIIHRVNYINGEPQKEVENLPRWKAYEDDARRQLAAHRAMIKAVGELERKGFDDWLNSTFPDKAPQEPREAPEASGVLRTPKSD